MSTETGVCKRCSKPLKNGNKSFCSLKCKKEFYELDKQCPTCKNYFTVTLSKKAAVYCSRTCAMKARGIKRTTRRAKRRGTGKRKDLGDIFMRSTWEANVARLMNWMGVVWQYETIWIDGKKHKYYLFEKIVRGNRAYVPDFWLPDFCFYIEVKGFMDPSSITKLKRMHKYYPDVKVMVLGAKEYKEIEDGYGWIFPEWEWATERKAEKAAEMRRLAGKVRPEFPKLEKLVKPHTSYLPKPKPKEKKKP